MKHSIAALILGLLVPNSSVCAFSPSTSRNGRTMKTSLSATSESNNNGLSRRVLFSSAATAASAFTSLVMSPNSAVAAGPPTQDDLKRIKIGYEGIEYLLANWEKETTICRVSFICFFSIHIFFSDPTREPVIFFRFDEKKIYRYPSLI